MSLTIDKQTIDDLNIFGKYRSNSVFNIFNKVKTIGGGHLLDSMFKKPFSDVLLINQRSKVFAAFQKQNLSFPLTQAEVAQLEDYLSFGISSNTFWNSVHWFIKKYQAVFLKSPVFHEMINRQIIAVSTLAKLKLFVDSLSKHEADVFSKQLSTLKQILSNPLINEILESSSLEDLTFLQKLQLDNKLHNVLSKHVGFLLKVIYELDVNIAVSKVAIEHNFSYAKAVPSTKTVLTISKFRHPALRNGVTNSITMNGNNNLMFLTGANMAGKSTLMKSIGTALFLAHLGFPVPAESMTFSVMNNLYTSINVSDNLEQGYSHFYAEVMRVKKAAENVRDGNNMLVIFDELFKGTNVKDAYDATLAVTKAFASHRNCLFVISTHIVEVGEALAEQDNIQFKYLPTIMDKNTTRYTYKLSEGISNDRHGMKIIKDEGILEMIKG